MSFVVTSTTIREGSVVTIDKLSISSRSKKDNDDNDKGDIIIRYGNEEYHMNFGTIVGETHKITFSYHQSQFEVSIVRSGRVYAKVFKTESKELKFSSTEIIVGKSEHHEGFSGSVTGLVILKKSYTVEQLVKEEYEEESISLSWQKSEWSYSGGAKEETIYIEDTNDGNDQGYEIYFTRSERGSATLKETKIKKSYKELSINIFVKSKTTEQYTIYKIGNLELQSRSKEEDDDDDEGDVILIYKGEEYRTNYGTIVGKSSRIFFNFRQSKFTLTISGSGRSYTKVFVSKSKEITFTQKTVVLGYSEKSKSSYEGSLIGFEFYEKAYSVARVIEERIEEKFISISWSKSSSSWKTTKGIEKRKVIIKDTDDGSEEGVELYYPDSREGKAEYKATSMRSSYSEFTVNIFVTSYSEEESTIYSIDDLVVKARSKKHDDDHDEGDVIIVYGKKQYSTKYGTVAGATSRILVSYWQGVCTVTITGSGRSFKQEFQLEIEEIKFSKKEVVLGKSYSGTIREFTFYEEHYSISEVIAKQTEKRYIQISCDSEWKLSGGTERRDIEGIPDDYDDGSNEEYQISFPSSGKGLAKMDSESLSEISSKYSMFFFVTLTSKEESVLFYSENFFISVRGVEEDDDDEGDLIINSNNQEYHTYYGLVIRITSRITIIYDNSRLTVAITGGGRSYKRVIQLNSKSRQFEKSVSLGKRGNQRGLSGSISGLYIFKEVYTLKEIITKKNESSSAIIDWSKISWHLSGGAVKEKEQKDEETYEIVFPKNGKGYAELQKAEFKDSYEEFTFSIYITSSNEKQYGTVFSSGSSFSVKVKTSHGHDDEGDVILTINSENFQTHYGFEKDKQSLLVISKSKDNRWRIQISGNGRKYDKVFESKSEELKFSKERFILGISQKDKKSKDGFKGSLSGFYMYSKVYSNEEVEEKKIEESSYIINWNTAKWKVKKGAITTRNGYGVSFQRSLFKHPRATLQNERSAGKSSTFTVIITVLLGTIGGGTIVTCGDNFAFQASPRYSFYNGDFVIYYHGEEFHTHFGLDSHSMSLIVLGFNKGLWSVEIGENGKLLYNATFKDTKNSYYFPKNELVVLGQRVKDNSYSHGFVGVVTTFSVARGRQYSFQEVSQKKVKQSTLTIDWRTAMWELEDGAEILDDKRSRHHHNGLFADGFLFDFSEREHGNGFLDWLHGHGKGSQEDDDDDDDDDGHDGKHKGEGSHDDDDDDEDGHGRKHKGEGSHDDDDDDDDDGHGRKHKGEGSHDHDDDDNDGHDDKHKDKGSHKDDHDDKHGKKKHDGKSDKHDHDG